MRVLIADDHDLLRDTLVLFLQSQGDIETSTAADLAGACKLIETEEPYDLVLLDLNMPGMNGLDGLKHALALGGGQRVALLSGEATRDIAEQALEAGAAGFVPKTLPAKSMINAVKFMAMGEQYAPIDFMTAVDETPSHPLADKLTPRELAGAQRPDRGQIEQGDRPRSGYHRADGQTPHEDPLPQGWRGEPYPGRFDRPRGRTVLTYPEG